MDFDPTKLTGIAAVVVVVWFFLQYMREERKARAVLHKEAKEDRQAYQTTLTEERQTERALTKEQRKEFSDLLREYRTQSVRLAEDGQGALDRQTAILDKLATEVVNQAEAMGLLSGSIESLKELLAMVNDQMGENHKMVERALRKLEERMADECGQRDCPLKHGISRGDSDEQQ